MLGKNPTLPLSNFLTSGDCSESLVFLDCSFITPVFASLSCGFLYWMSSGIHLLQSHYPLDLGFILIQYDLASTNYSCKETYSLIRSYSEVPGSCGFGELLLNTVYWLITNCCFFSTSFCAYILLQEPHYKENFQMHGFSGTCKLASL